MKRDLISSLRFSSSSGSTWRRRSSESLGDRGVLHVGMARVEPLAVGENLLQLPAEDEIGEEPGRVRMRREAGDGARRHDERDTLLGEHHLDRVALLLGLVERVVAPVHRDGPLARGHHSGRIHGRLHEHELVLRELLPVVPAMEMNERQHVGGDDTAVARVRGHHLALPSRIEQVLPRLRAPRWPGRSWCCRRSRSRCPKAVVVAVLVLEPRREALDAGGVYFIRSFFSLSSTKWPASEVWITSAFLMLAWSSCITRWRIRCEPVRCTSTLTPG